MDLASFAARLCLFIAAGWFMITHPYSGSWRYPPEFSIAAGYVGIIFFGLGVLVCLIMIINCLIHRPIARIYDNRIECLVPILQKYKTILYLDVESFSIFDFEISIMGHRGRIPRQLVADKVKRGFPYSTYIQERLVPNIDELCYLLNQKLAAYKDRPMFTQTLNVESLPGFIEKLGIAHYKYSFEEIARPDIVTIVKKKTCVQITYYNRYSEVTKCSRYRNEHNACRAFLEHLIRQQILEKE